MLVGCRSVIFNNFCRRFGVDLGAQKGAQMKPKRSPKRSKIKAKIQHEKISLWGLSWTSLWSVLGRIRTHLGVKVFVNITFLKKINHEKASWEEFGPIWMPKRVQKGSQIGAQMEPKWYRKSIKK